MNDKKLKVAIIWHMHQPWYRDEDSQEFVFPWVRLHTAKSYYMMPSLVEKFGRIKVTFNLTPSLIRQIELYAQGQAKERLLDLSLKDPSSLSSEETELLISEMCEDSSLKRVRTWPRYLELARKKEELMQKSPQTLSQNFSEQEIIDLQVVFNLSWIDPDIVQQDPELSLLKKRGSNFDPADREKVIDKQLEIIGQTIPKYDSLLRSGRIELITSPFYHPILPLLCNIDSSKYASPSIPLPSRRFAHKRDARSQLKRALDYFSQTFKSRPRGIWPPELALSEDAIALLSELKVQWTVSDESVLARSINRGLVRDVEGTLVSPEDLYVPYLARRAPLDIKICFRDANLSNKVSFDYQKYPAEEAVADLMARLSRIKHAQDRSDREFLVVIALDGENAWDHYDNNGHDFLEAFYAAIEQSDFLQTVTPTEYFDEHLLEDRPIRWLMPGSWVDGNLETWIGHDEKNRAWDALSMTRSFLFEQLKQADFQVEEALYNAAWNQIHIAEGSDWFWWFGKEKVARDSAWDELFRSHLQRVYRLFGTEPAPELLVPIMRRVMEAQRLNILMVASEAAPLAKVGGLADVVGSLPKYLNSLGHDVRVFMPCYGTIDEQKFNVQTLATGLTIEFGGRKVIVGVKTASIAGGVKVYLVDAPDYYKREGRIYGFPDDGERFLFLCKAALDTAEQLGIIPDIVHCHDWHTAMIPEMLKKAYAARPSFANAAAVFTIHNLAFQGVCDRNILGLVGISPGEVLDIAGVEQGNTVNMMARAIYYADAVNTVSKTYAREIQTPEMGYGLNQLLSTFNHKLYGILNGIDHSVYNPATDPHIYVNYDTSTHEKKAENKKRLQEELNLPVRPDVPMIGFVSRLYSQKGLDLIKGALAGMLELDIQFVVLGIGDKTYEDMFMEAAKSYPTKMSANITFNIALAQKIYASSDMFLMPSQYEPCGLGQMIALRYGSIPIVRDTGGLADTIKDFDPTTKEGNGFKFKAYSPWAMFAAIVRAIATYHDKEKWTKLVTRAMLQDFSWSRSALEYQELYRKAIDVRKEALLHPVMARDHSLKPA